MAIQVGDKLPGGTLLRMGENGPESVELADFTTGRKVVIFGLPGAYTGTCTSAHVPSFIRTFDGLKDKGVEEVICVSVNDPFVMSAWGESTGATATGIVMLGDADSSFTKAIGMEFTAPPVGFFDRCMRFSALVDDGVVKILHKEEKPGVCETTAGETMLAEL